MTEYLTREQITAVDDIETEDVHVPEWGGTVRLRGLTGMQRARINGMAVAVRGQSVSLKTEALAEEQLRVVAACLIGPDGRQLFSIKEFARIGEKNASVVQRLYERASELSGTTVDAVEETAGNSEAAPSGSSISG